MQNHKLLILRAVLKQAGSNSDFWANSYQENKYYYEQQNHSFCGLNEEIRHFQGVLHGEVITIAQKAISLQPTKFHAISTPRPTIYASDFLPCASFSSARESTRKPWRFVLHHEIFPSILLLHLLEFPTSSGFHYR